MMSAEELTIRFFLAAAIILIACKLVSLLVGRAGQPPVVGEMITGVLLGPSLLGEISPHLEAGLFPKALLPVIYVAGQLGLAALMFQAGRELRGYLRPGTGRVAGTISALGVGVPLVAGGALALAFEGHVAITVPGISGWVTAAFVGVTLAITAFPMLARIIIERGLSGTRFGSLALACGGIDDMAAWLMLAGVLSLASGKSWPITKAVAGAVIFAAIVAFVVRPLLNRYLRGTSVTPQTVLLVTVVLVFGASWFTSDIGLYAVFGAFSVGLVMPPELVPADLVPADLVPADPVPSDPVPAESRVGRPGGGVEPGAGRPDLVTPTMGGISAILVPMFFTYSGLNTRFALLADPRVLGFSVAAIAVAIVSKGGACWLGARLAGERGSVPGRIGALMNARGLMQLIALNVGLQAGVASQDLFTSLVLVALVTTIMTAPLLSWLDRRDARAARGVGLLAVVEGQTGGVA
jgi:Kef-type K+ transport system membrane component KefB